MNKLIKLNSDILKIVLIFTSWKVILLLTLFLSINFIPLAFTDRFLGGGPIVFKVSPYLFSWANFDGEHYLSLSLYGYKSLEQAFFPIFPLLISVFAKPFSQTVLTSIISHTIIGLIISNASFLIGLVYLFKLIKIDYQKKIAFLTILFLIFFPTSFFFGSLYNESLFFLLSVLTFLKARQGHWLQASLFGAAASATRAFGILLLPALLIEAFVIKENWRKFFWVFLIPFGLIFYMIYQYMSVGDAFAFYHLQTIIGAQHQQGFIFLPQVYFRYIKILLTFDGSNPFYQTIILEFASGILFFVLPLVGFFKKVRISYLFYALLGFLIPTIQGSFSSTPRYVIVLFPSFLVLALMTEKIKRLRYLLLLIFIILLIIETSLFLRGYWVA